MPQRYGHSGSKRMSRSIITHADKSSAASSSVANMGAVGGVKVGNTRNDL